MNGNPEYYFYILLKTVFNFKRGLVFCSLSFYLKYWSMKNESIEELHSIFLQEDLRNV